MKGYPMTQPARFQDDQTAQTYERLLLPRVFRPWGELLLGKVGLNEGSKVLDVATGPGTLARLAAERVGSEGKVTGIDLSANMLAQARAKPPLAKGAALEYLQGPADSLPFESGSFDVVLCQQGLQFFPNQGAALAEMRRVLKPQGSLGLASWDGPKAMALFSSFLSALDQLQDPLNPPPPIGWFDTDRLGELLVAAGFQGIRIETATLHTDFDDLGQALACAEGTSASQGLRALDADKRVRFNAFVEEAIRPYARAKGYRIPSRSILGLAKA
jgi:SAM-dependent methyltransferase